MIQVRKEQKKDWDDVGLLNLAAFGQPDEGHIVDKLRGSGKKTLSLVAICENTILGHIMFSPAMLQWLKGRRVKLREWALPPCRFYRSFRIEEFDDALWSGIETQIPPTGLT